MMKLFDLTGKKALVTGGGRGIGLALAKGLHEAGVRVAILDVAGESAESHGEVVGLGTLGKCECEVGRAGDLACQEEGQHLGHLDGRDGGDPREQAFGLRVVGRHGGSRDEHEVAPSSGP